MILKRLRLRNIRSYSSQEIEFPSGSVLLAGDIGAGKSTILHAVEFALFGTRRDLSGDALLRKGENKGEVELSMQLGGQEIRIKRGLKRSKESVLQEAGHVIVDGVKQDLTPVEIKAKILDLLGYPKELLTKSKALVYRYTVYTPQEEMKQILFENPDARVDTLRKVFGIDKYKRIIENAQLYSKSLRDKRRVLEATVQDLPVKQKELELRKQELVAKQMEIDSVKEQVDKVKVERQGKEKELAVHEERIKEYNELRRKLEGLKTKLQEVVKQRGKNTEDIGMAEEQVMKLKKKLEEMKFEVKEYPKVSDLDQMVKQKEERLQKMVSKKTELIERKNNLIARSGEVAKELEGKKVDDTDEMGKLVEELKDKDMIRTVLDETEKTIKELEERSTELRTKKNESEKMTKKISELDVCPTCMQEVSVSHKEKIREKEGNRITLFSRELEGLVEKREEARKRLLLYKERMDVFVEQEKKIAAMKVKKENIDRVKKEVERLRKQREVLERQKIDVLKSLEEVDDSLIEELREEIDSKKRMIKEIHDYDIKIQGVLRIKELLTQKEEMRNKLVADNERLKEDVKAINVDTMKLNAEIEAHKDIDDMYNSVKQELQKVLDREKGFEVKFGELRKEIEGIEKIKKMLEDEVVAKKTNVAEVVRLGNINEWIEKLFVNMMATMERHIMIKIHQEFNELFVQWFDVLIDDADLSVRLDDSFCPVVQQNGYDTFVDHLSGGEKTSVALAYRLALNKVVNDIVDTIKTKDLIILDEPTDGFSSEQLDKVREVLDQLNMKQIILVSHEGKIESFVDNVIRVHKREHVSSVV